MYDEVKQLGIYRFNDDVVMPDYGTKASACFDLCAYIPSETEVTYFSSENNKDTVVINDNRLIMKPFYRYMIPTGLIMDIPTGYHVKVHPRSGQSIKQGLITVNNTGIIDEDYVEECKCLMINTSDINIVISNGERIAQAELCRVEPVVINSLEERPKQKTDRDGGFGSTGQ